MPARTAHLVTDGTEGERRCAHEVALGLWPAAMTVRAWSVPRGALLVVPSLFHVLLEHQGGLSELRDRESGRQTLLR